MMTAARVAGLAMDAEMLKYRLYFLCYPYHTPRRIVSSIVRQRGYNQRKNHAALALRNVLVDNVPLRCLFARIQ